MISGDAGGSARRSKFTLLAGQAILHHPHAGPSCSASVLPLSSYPIRRLQQSRSNLPMYRHLLRRWRTQGRTPCSLWTALPARLTLAAPSSSGEESAISAADSGGVGGNNR